MEEDQVEKLAMFMTVTSCETEVAMQYLESCSWDVENAINTFLAGGGTSGGGGGGGGGGGSGGGGADPYDAMSDDFVRAPIEQKVDRLFDRPVLNAFRGGAPLAHGLAAHAHTVHQKEAFRDFEHEASSMKAIAAENASAAAGTDPSAITAAAASGGGASKKPKNLAEIYRPPLELCFHGSFDELRRAGREQGKWLLINIQSPVEFASQQLNADTWRDETLRTVIGAHFFFWQHYDDSPLGKQYGTFYLADKPGLPHIGIVDPRTGELCKALVGFVGTERLMDVLMTYADKELQPMPTIGYADNVAHAADASAAGASAAGAPIAFDDEARRRAAPAVLEEDADRAIAPLAHADAATPAQPAALDPTIDDAFWAAYAPAGDEPCAGAGVVQLVVKLPDGSRSAARHFSEHDRLGTVLCCVHQSGYRLASAHAWSLVQTMPRAMLSDLAAPLSSIGLCSGKAMLMLQEEAGS